MELEKLKRKISGGKQIEEVLGKFDWKDFEQTVGDIFRQNDFKVRNNFRFKTRRTYEIDLIAVRGRVVFCVDCKRWSNSREKIWGLAKAAKEQERRTSELEKFVRSNPIARSMMKIPDGKFVPMLATLHQEKILKEGKTFVAPVKKLNTFILEHETII